DSLWHLAHPLKIKQLRSSADKNLCCLNSSATASSCNKMANSKCSILNAQWLAPVPPPDHLWSTLVYCLSSIDYPTPGNALTPPSPTPANAPCLDRRAPIHPQPVRHLEGENAALANQRHSPASEETAAARAHAHRATNPQGGHLAQSGSPSVRRNPATARAAA